MIIVMTLLLVLVSWLIHIHVHVCMHVPSWRVSMVWMLLNILQWSSSDIRFNLSMGWKKIYQQKKKQSIVSSGEHTVCTTVDVHVVCHFVYIIFLFQPSLPLVISWYTHTVQALSTPPLSPSLFPGPAQLYIASSTFTFFVQPKMAWAWERG